MSLVTGGWRKLHNEVLQGFATCSIRLTLSELSKLGGQAIHMREVRNTYDCVFFLADEQDKCSFHSVQNLLVSKSRLSYLFNLYTSLLEIGPPKSKVKQKILTEKSCLL
jgi:hypothetical protein